MTLYHTDPRMDDTDNDNLNDRLEVKLGTDPTNYDTDGDGVLNGSEVLAGYDPLNASNHPGISPIIIGAGIGGGAVIIVALISILFRR